MVLVPYKAQIKLTKVPFVAILISVFLYVGSVVASEVLDSTVSQAHSYYARGDYKKASSAIIKAYELAEREFSDRYALSDYAYQVAAIHQNIGNYDIADKYHLINLEIKKKHLTLPDGQLIYAYNNVASVKILKGQYKEATAILHDLDTETNRESIEEMSFVYSNLARGYLGIGKLDLAETYLHRALSYFEKKYGDQNVVVSDVRFTKAELLRKQGRIKEALALAEGVLAALRKSGYSGLPFYQEVAAFISELKAIKTNR